MVILTNNLSIESGFKIIIILITINKSLGPIFISKIITIIVK